ncbi:hypothetical protein Patl1_21058 [Pistacia atlantica]|uniref:Uncharacterized protein n=1 Tax=Pistacia atlantica TaxID=434234 RepID=A0ACC1BK84_9ROSI|nr:hypothetical protein Patl1_21058 [Pistacia atlantica]
MIVFKTLRKHTLSHQISIGEQRRWKKKLVESAQTRLENRTRDSKLDKLATKLKTLKTILSIHQLLSTRKRGPFVSVQLMSRWKNILGLNVHMGKFIHKYPHVFHVFTHPLKRNFCCKLTARMKYLLDLEDSVIKQCEFDAVSRIKKLLLISQNGSLHVHALRLIRRELGLPEDFRESILGKYSSDFRLVDLEIVELANRDENLGDAAVEKWRENEYEEKWLSEFEVKFAFPINFPTGFEIGKGFREKLKNWQRLPYIKPYERKQNSVRVRTCGGIERFEKRAVGIIHELLSLTVEKTVEVERLVHFRKDLAMEINVRELLLKHPGIFYISTKGSTQTVFLREAYSKGCLVEPNPVYDVRRKMLDLILLGCRNTRELQHEEDIKEQSDNGVGKIHEGGTGDGDWVIPILESSQNGNSDDHFGQICSLFEEDFDSCSEQSSSESEHAFRGDLN